jgi:hypothetical protein
MGNIVQSKFHENEIAKSEDFGFVTESDVNNLESMLHKLIGEPTNHCILRGGTVSQRSTPSMNVDIAAILAISADGELIYADSVTGPVSVEDGEASDRIDTLEIRRVDTDYDAKQRAFKDPDTGTVTYSNVDTKVRTEIEAQVVKGTAGSGNAPASTVGWMKLAEIHVSAGETTSILNAHIENVTADLDGGTNSEWTTETGSAWKIGDIVYLKDMFREKHLEDGDHKNDVIRDNHIDWGTGSGQVSAADVPIADGGNRYTGTNVETAMQEVAGAGRTTETVKGNADDLTSHEGTTAAGVHGSASAATANRLVHRDAAGRAKVAAPSASDDIARKNEVDTVQTNLNSHINDTSAAHAASAISAMDEFAHSSSSNVQDVLDDLDQAITNHQNDTVDAHDASAISTVDEFANSNATNVQDVLDDLDQHIENLENLDPTQHTHDDRYYKKSEVNIRTLAALEKTTTTSSSSYTRTLASVTIGIPYSLAHEHRNQNSSERRTFSIKLPPSGTYHWSLVCLPEYYTADYNHNYAANSGVSPGSSTIFSLSIREDSYLNVLVFYKRLS